MNEWMNEYEGEYDTNRKRMRKQREVNILGLYGEKEGQYDTHVSFYSGDIFLSKKSIVDDWWRNIDTSNRKLELWLIKGLLT